MQNGYSISALTMMIMLRQVPIALGTKSVVSEQGNDHCSSLLPI